MKIMYPVLGFFWFILAASLIRLTWSWVTIIGELFTDDFVKIVYWVFLFATYTTILIVTPVYLTLLGYRETDVEP